MIKRVILGAMLIATLTNCETSDERCLKKFMALEERYTKILNHPQLEIGSEQHKNILAEYQRDMENLSKECR